MECTQESVWVCARLTEKTFPKKLAALRIKSISRSSETRKLHLHKGAVFLFLPATMCVLHLFRYDNNHECCSLKLKKPSPAIYRTRFYSKRPNSLLYAPNFCRAIQVFRRPFSVSNHPFYSNGRTSKPNIRRAVFSIWQLKPHSLSYHANTLTILPSVTLVSVESNVLAWVVWLKSIETSGRVL